LPEEVQRNGGRHPQEQPDILMVVFMLSPDDTFDSSHISNYALLQIRGPAVAAGRHRRHPDFRRARLFDAALARSRQDHDARMTAGDVLAAIRAQTCRSRAGQFASRDRRPRVPANLTFTGA